ncbi:WD40 repeat domain-containing protein [Streptomyces sp. BRA346]|uniref:WD40 repeat domain-containing protein n=1 Tax=Streptomyces sp. BRA346 TaxID=2878199 RepID=UPI004063343C
MNPDQLLRDTLREWSEETSAPAGRDLASRALRRRSRRRTATATGAAVLALLAGGAAVVVPMMEEPQNLHLSGPAYEPRPDRVLAHPDESPPRHLIAAGDLAVSAYRTGGTPEKGGGSERLTYDWYLYDTGKQRYAKTPWGDLDVVPGMKAAAVLEKTLPTSRVGILDLRTGKVVQWIPLDHEAGGVSWSPDGTRLAVTTYSGDPDVEATPANRGTAPRRTGYYVIDIETGDNRYRPLPASLGGRTDIRWSRDGTRLADPAPTHGYLAYYDLQGRPAPTPPYEGAGTLDLGRSPDGRYYATGDGRTGEVKDARTHRTVGDGFTGSPLAWTSDGRLLRWEDCGDDCTDDRYERLVLTDPEGRTTVPLTGFRASEGRGAWEPVITRR